MSRRSFIAWAAVITLLTVVRVGSTHLVFSQTTDEPIHIATGHEWLTQGTYALDAEHPPLSRIAVALPFRNVPTTHPVEEIARGNDLLAAEDRYIHNLAKARRGILPFLVVAMAALALWTRRLFGDVAALVALVLFASNPPVLAHAGLATTDLAGAAAFAMACWAMTWWCDEPSWSRTIFLGLSIGIGLATKYSFLVFFGAAALIILIVRRRFSVRRLSAAIVLAFVLVWGVFQFSIGTMRQTNRNAASIARDVLGSERLTDITIPAPDFVLGLLRVKQHDQLGHPAFLLGRFSDTGWWYYFPVALALKTPIPLLLLALAGTWLLVRRKMALELPLIALAVLAITMTSHINIGVRHLLPIYVPLSMIAAYGVVSLAGRARPVFIALVAWLVLSSAAAHPDYIPWMNAMAGRHPERMLLDSNFDWGQDIWRLIRLCKRRGVHSLGYIIGTNIRGSSVHFGKGYHLDPHHPGSGWMVAGEHSLAFSRRTDPTAFDWLTSGRPFERVGTLRLYYVPPASQGELTPNPGASLAR